MGVMWGLDLYHTILSYFFVVSSEKINRLFKVYQNYYINIDSCTPIASEVKIAQD